MLTNVNCIVKYYHNSHAGWTDQLLLFDLSITDLLKNSFKVHDSIDVDKSLYKWFILPSSLYLMVVKRKLINLNVSRLHSGYISLWLFSSFSSGYHMQTARDMRPHPSVSLNPTTNPPQFRSRNQSYMRAVSTFSQASCLSQVSPTTCNTNTHVGLFISQIICWFCEMPCVRLCKNRLYRLFDLLSIYGSP